MAKERLINTKFWNDGWIRELSPLQRYLFFYLLTNEHTNISGIYELPLSTMEYETSLSEKDLKVILSKLQPKIYYKDGWMIITNFLKHQHLNSETVLAGIQKQISDAPQTVIEHAQSIGYGYGMDRVWVRYNISNLNIIKTKSESELAPDKKFFELKKEMRDLGQKKKI